MPLLKNPATANLSSPPENSDRSIEVIVLLTGGGPANATVVLHDTGEGTWGPVLTGEDGKAWFVGLPPGIYRPEVILPQGACLQYQIQTVDLTDKTHKEIYAICVQSSSLKIRATIGSSGSPVAGAMFEILDRNGTSVGTLTTAADGTASMKELAPGRYAVRACYTPDGVYLFRDEPQIISVSDGDDLLTNFLYGQYAGLELEIVSYKGTPLGGSYWRLVPKNGGKAIRQPECSFEEMKNITRVCFHNLKPGNYELKELRTPPGYFSYGESEQFSLTEGNIVYHKIVYYAQIMDRLMKKVVSTPFVLSNLLHSFVDEFKKMPPEEIQKTVLSDPRFAGQDNAVIRAVRGLQNEEGSGVNGMLSFDNLFAPVLPAGSNKNDNDILVFVNIDGESEGKHAKYTELECGIAHLCHMIVGQRGTAEGYSGMNYSNIKKCYCFIIRVNSSADEENSILYGKFCLSKLNLDTEELTDVEIAIERNLLNLYIINLGNADALAAKYPAAAKEQKPGFVALSMLDLFFYLEGPPKEDREKRLEGMGYDKNKNFHKEVVELWSIEDGIAYRVRNSERKKHDMEMQDTIIQYEEELQDQREQYEGIIQQQQDMLTVGAMHSMGYTDEDISREKDIPLHRVRELFHNFQAAAGIMR